MRVKSIVSALALTSAMIVAPAFAQDAGSWTIAGNPVAEADQAAVQATCDELNVGGTSDISSSVSTDTETGADNTDSLAADTSSNDSPPAEGTENAVTTIDLSTITLDDCVAGGWVTQ